MYKVTIIGHFGSEKNFYDGQTIKTKTLYEELKINLKKESINILDTYRWKKNILVLLKSLLKAIKNSENILIITAHNGVKIFIPIIVFLNKFFKRKIHYSVVGAWLPDLLKKNNWLIGYLNKINVIYVETLFLKNQLEGLGVKNIVYAPNFKKLNILNEKDVVYNFKKPLKVCTFSRINEKKGIEDLCLAINKINKKYNDIYTLDVYGEVEANYKLKFELLQKNFNSFMSYKGVVDYKKTTEVLKGYYMLIFPTKYKTEGVPGTIIDAYSAGLPVIASDWNSAKEIIDINLTGLIYKLGNVNDLYIKLEKAIDNKEINRMKKNCIKKAKKYSSESIINIYLSNLE